MTRYVALLRGINLGNRRVKMADLRARFEELGLEGVGSHIASGNVIFDRAETDVAALEARIEAHLEATLGFFTDTMIRSMDDVAVLVRRDEIAHGEADGFTTYVTFAKGVLDDDVAEAHRALETPDDRFHVLEREVLWLRRGRLTDSTINTNDLEKAIGGMANTRRKVTTIRKLVDKFSG